MKNKMEFSQRDIAYLAIFGALTLLLGFTNLGYIPIPFLGIDITTIHIPTIIVAVLLGWQAGGLMGLLFGITSLITAFMRPTPLSPMFFNPLVSVLPRVCVGIAAGLVFELMQKKKLPLTFSLPIAAIVGTLTNTILVLSSMLLIYSDTFIKIFGPHVFKVISFIVGTNGVVEMIVAILLVVPIGIAVLPKHNVTVKK